MPTSETPQARVTREDLVLFINACFACTRQDEFYSDARGQAVSVDFLHTYILGNYRRLYARTLALGINDSNASLVLVNLLRTGRETPDEFRQEENQLLHYGIRRLPPQRALKVFERLRRERVNNRRTRALIRDYLAERPDPHFDAVKYRSKVARAAAHAHLALGGELGRFLFRSTEKGRFETPLFKAYRAAHFSESAIYELPYTIAEGFAAKHGVPRDRFLQKIEPRLTHGERLRLARTAERADLSLDVDLGSMPLTRLALFVLSLPVGERESSREKLTHALEQSARRAARSAEAPLGKVAAILDRSYSSSGSREKRRRPLAVALAANILLEQVAREYRGFWAPQSTSEHLATDPLAVVPRGQTRLADALISALDWGAEMVVIVSDGFENDPPGATHAVARAFRAYLDPQARVSIVHVNPVFDAENFEPRTLGPGIPTVGIRDAEDLPTLLRFARFVDGTADARELERHLERRVEAALRPDSPT